MSDEILANVRKYIIECRSELAEATVKLAIKTKIDPFIVLDVMTRSIKEVGDAFGRGELWLPDLVGAANAMQAALPVLDMVIKDREKIHKGIGIIIIGTVFGDIHTIGKDMVKTLLIAAGFTVIDLGVNIVARKFIDAVIQHNADIIAMSALMTTTCAEQGKVISALKKENIRDKVKVMVGGAAVSEEFAQSIGADGYDATAPGAVELAKSLIQRSL